MIVTPPFSNSCNANNRHQSSEVWNAPLFVQDRQIRQIWVAMGDAGNAPSRPTAVVTQ